MAKAKKIVRPTALKAAYEEEAMGLMVPTVSAGGSPDFAKVSRKVLGRAARVHTRLLSL